ncbi:MAG: hypothetical protein ABH879_02360 [archaeon]
MIRVIDIVQGYKPSKYRLVKNSRISRKRKTIKQMRAEVEDLLGMEELLSRFERECLRRYVSLSEEHLKDRADRKRVDDALVKLSLLHSQIAEKTRINDNLELLAYYLPRLKTLKITKDAKEASRIFDKFLNQNRRGNLHALIAEIRAFELKLNETRDAYKAFSATLKSYPSSLEGLLEMNNKHLYYLSGLYGHWRKQKELAFHIGSTFREISSELLRDRDIKLA